MCVYVSPGSFYLKEFINAADQRSSPSAYNRLVKIMDLLWITICLDAELYGIFLSIYDDRYRTVRIYIRIHPFLSFTSVPDPDPPGSEIIWPQGSGSFPFSHQT